MTRSLLKALQLLQKLEALLEIGLGLVQTVHADQETFRSGRSTCTLHHLNAEPNFVHSMQGGGSEFVEALRRCSTNTLGYLRDELARNFREGALGVQESYDWQQAEGCSFVCYELK